MRNVLIAIVLALCATTAVQADIIVSLDLVLDNAAPGTWEVFAAIDDPDNLSQGIDTFRFDVWGEGGAAVTSSKNESPTGTDFRNGTDGGGYYIPINPNMWGFSELRSDHDEGNPGFNIVASQRSAGPNANANAVLQDIGLCNGSRQPRWHENPYAGGSSTDLGDPVDWSARVLLASGDYTGDSGELIVGRRTAGDELRDSFILLKNVGKGWTGPGNLLTPTAVLGDVEPIPEPSTIVMLAIGSFGLFLLRRRRNG